MNSGIYRFYKRLTAMLLAICMIAGLVMGQPNILSYASTELQNEDLGDGASEATAYTWKNGSVTGQGGGGNSWRFDLRGLQAGQHNYAQAGIKTTYSNGGYATWFQVGTNSKQLIGGNTNGGVQSLDTYGIEVKIAVSPSPDNKYVFVDYYVYDKNGQGGSTGRTIKMGTGTDVMIGGTQEDDYATVYKNDRGFHMVNQHVKTTFDCITNDSSLGVTPPDTRWIGHYNSWGSNVFNESSNDVVSGTDSGMAYSWEFQLHPYETVHRRVAFAIRDTSYYVSDQYGQDSTSAEGTYSSPFKTIEYALNKIGNNKGYIYVMDYPEISSAIDVTGNSQKDITIASTDYDHEGHPMNEDGDYIKTLTRASGYTGPLFNVSGPTLKFTDIVLDGNHAESQDSLISASSGKLEINSGAVITNCSGSESSQGSAVNVTGSAGLSMNFGTVSGNVSAGKGAVYYNGSGAFEIRNRNQISDNTTPSGKKANVYLAQDKYITVMSDLDTSQIGVTAEQLPLASPGGISSQPSQEVKIAVPSSSYPGAAGSCPFADNFKADQEAGNSGVYVSAGTEILGNGRNAVLKRNGYTVSFIYRDSATGGTVNGAPASIPLSYAGGDAVEVNAPAAITGYGLTGVTIDQGTGGTLSAQADAGVADFGKVTGTMPGQDVVITYEYTRNSGSIVFEANGGTPEPQALTGSVGGSVNALLPNISRYGYQFVGWSTVNDRVNPDLISGLPSEFPEDPVTYYAIFSPDSNVKFDYTVDYVNADGSIVFQSTTTEDAYSVEAEVHSGKKNIHGYTWSLADSSTNPAIYNYGDGHGPVPFGNFNGGTGDFSGKMPGQDAAVKYGYQVDRSNPNAKSAFTVKYVTENGTVVHTADIQDVFPEDAIAAVPADVYGFRYLSGSITAGSTADDTDGHLVSAVQGGFDSDGRFTGTMPNQPVEITYLYEATEEGYEYKIHYLDNGTQDERLRNITGPDIQNVTADTPVTAEFKNMYGYVFQDERSEPASAGTFDSSHNFTGTMPNDRLAVTYRYDRDPSKWANLIYKAGEHGVLRPGNGMSSDVVTLSGGAYRASVLINDGTVEGTAGSYTWNDILEKRLVPETAADTYYRFEGWFIDQNGNGIKDSSEELLSADSRFTGSATVTAYFAEDPDQWIDIHFTAGEHGTINAGENVNLHIQYDRTWADITGNLPAYTPEVNYLVDGWYDGGVPVEDDNRLVNGNTYTIRFYPDPAVFGTDVAARDASAGIDTQGKGKITVYGTTQGYQYIITDMEGNIIDVVRGNISGRVYFEDLYPGTRYLIYEATGTTQAQPGRPIDSVTGIMSSATEVLVPVVETNYQVLYDEEHEGKAVFVIKPADADSDYAILDKDGNAVTTPETGDGGWQSAGGSQPASLTFSGLDYNEEYVVVARPQGSSGITAESKLEDGTHISTDPGGELDIPNYVVEAINGQVHSVDGVELNIPRYDEVHKGDEVMLHAEETDGNGQNFLYWKVTIGAVPGMTETIRRQDVTFTMPDSNVVMTAYYEREAATPSNATVTDEVRGGNKHEMALDPNEIENLEEELTTDADRTLMDVNHADVTYKVVYKKNVVKATESNAIKSSPYYDSDHEEAYHGAWGLNVDIERYVNGRKVGVASPSEATFNTYVQLDKEDVDMMDYQLFAISEDDDGELIIDSVAMSDDPEETGGLFTFTAQAGMRYVLIYSRAYRIYFINNKEEPKYRYYFKVRRGEAPGSGAYSFEYGQVEIPIDSFIDNEGIEFTYIGWSYREDRLKEFDPDKEIKRKTYVYAFYDDNSGEVNDARKQLEDAIKAAIEKSDDYFLTLKETEKIREAIEEAMDVFDRTGPRATLDELLEALNRLEETCKPFDKILEDRYDHYDKIQSGGNSGGTSGGDGWGSGSHGGSGSGSGGSKGGSKGGGGSSRSAGTGGPVTTPAPYVAETSKSYVVGTNGNWELVDPESDKWAFVLNGGIRLTSIWAKLDYANGDVNRNGWYHFNASGLMDYGWFRDEHMNWYYCNAKKDGWLGKMKTGWHYDEIDKHWYYLDLITGQMVMGWKEIEGKWYFFTPQNTAQTYSYDRSTGKWVFMQNQERPLGSMYSNEKTPDGYQVGTDGALQ